MITECDRCSALMTHTQQRFRFSQTTTQQHFSFLFSPETDPSISLFLQMLPFENTSFLYLERFWQTTEVLNTLTAIRSA